MSPRRGHDPQKLRTRDILKVSISRTRVSRLFAYELLVLVPRSFRAAGDVIPENSTDGEADWPRGQRGGLFALGGGHLFGVLIFWRVTDRVTAGGSRSRFVKFWGGGAQWVAPTDGSEDQVGCCCCCCHFPSDEIPIKLHRYSFNSNNSWLVFFSRAKYLQRISHCPDNSSLMLILESGNENIPHLC